MIMTFIAMCEEFDAFIFWLANFSNIKKEYGLFSISIKNIQFPV